MEVTSLDISKKLAEIGFKANTPYYWYIYDQGIQMRHIAEGDGRGNYKCYDLETILKTLPMGIDRDDKRYDLVIEQRVFFYYSDDDGNELEEFSIMQKGEESLADTAAQLLIQLYEAGIVKFKEE